jgi:hypothetical protein
MQISAAPDKAVCSWDSLPAILHGLNTFDSQAILSEILFKQSKKNILVVRLDFIN